MRAPAVVEEAGLAEAGAGPAAAAVGPADTVGVVSTARHRERYYE